MRKRAPNFKPKADDFEKAAANLEARAANLRASPDAVTVGNDQIVHSIAQFVRVIGHASSAADRSTRIIVWLTVLTVALTILNVVLVERQIADALFMNRVQNNIALSSTFYNNANNLAIISALEDDMPILITNMGKFSLGQLDNYLGDFDTIADAYESRLLTERQLCDSFSYYVVQTHENPEIRNYIAEQRKDDPNFFRGLDDLYGVVMASKDSTCH
jgi:hypothetical protein